ncbi:MAG TPA: glycosyltransferase family 9 protein [Bacteroidota bacterium]|nr:glycosyltransferase family 9 protein [Bacteroidota bacterium]
MEKNNFQHILVVRTDRIGDVLLTLPVITALHRNFPAVSVSMLLREYTRDLAETQRGVRSVLTYDCKGKQKSFFEMLGELRRARVDAAVTVYPRFRIALLLWLAGIPVRVGTAYRWYSFLFNARVYEHRKTAAKHEAEYNLSLLHALDCDVSTPPHVELVLTIDDVSAAEETRKKIGIIDTDRVVFLHPGSGGSARDWKPEQFALLSILLAEKGLKVVVTGSEQERTLIESVVKQSNNTAVPFISSLRLREFAALIRTAKLFIANSTGPLHLAAAVGIPVIGFYPPLNVMSPKRWGPLTEKKMIFVPDPAQCPRCNGGECQGNTCMDQITPEQVAGAAENLLRAYPS